MECETKLEDVGGHRLSAGQRLSFRRIQFASLKQCHSSRYLRAGLNSIHSLSMDHHQRFRAQVLFWHVIRHSLLANVSPVTLYACIRACTVL